MYPTFGVLGGISGEPVSCRAPSPTTMKESSSSIKEKTLLLTILCIPMLLLCPVYPCCTCLVWCGDCMTSTSLENRYAGYCSISFNLQGHMQCDHMWSLLLVVCNNIVAVA